MHGRANKRKREDSERLLSAEFGLTHFLARQDETRRAWLGKRKQQATPGINDHINAGMRGCLRLWNNSMPNGSTRRLACAGHPWQGALQRAHPKAGTVSTGCQTGSDDEADQ